jgi:hypothetical protein
VQSLQVMQALEGIDHSFVLVQGRGNNHHCCPWDMQPMEAFQFRGWPVWSQAVLSSTLCR